LVKKTSSDFEELLAGSSSAATPFLLELARRQAGRRRRADLLNQWGRDGFVAPSPLDQRVMHRLDGLALDAAEGFEALQLSPVAPLGVCSVITPTSQDRTLTAARGVEVISDPTNVLALECARRLGNMSGKERPSKRVRLCTVHQVLRTQPIQKASGFTRHFRLFALGEAGRGKAEDGFEVEAIARHVKVFDRLLDAGETLGCSFPKRRARVLVSLGQEVLGQRVREALEAVNISLEAPDEALENPYYDGIRVLFGAESRSGAFIPIGDTGRFDWMAQLTSNRKMRFVASGLGLQLMPLLF